MVRLFIALLFAAVLSAQEPYKIGGDVTAPVPIYRLEPGYSQEAKAAKLEGVVALAIVIDSGGMVSEAKVLKHRLVARETGAEAKDDLGLSKRALDCVVQWKFRPAMKDGRPVAVRANVEMNFRLL